MKYFLKLDMYFTWICYKLQGNQLSFLKSVNIQLD